MPKIPHAKDVHRKRVIKAISEVSLHRSREQNLASSKLALELAKAFKKNKKQVASLRRIAVARRFAAMQQSGVFERIKRKQKKG